MRVAASFRCEFAGSRTSQPASNPNNTVAKSQVPSLEAEVRRPAPKVPSLKPQPDSATSKPFQILETASVRPTMLDAAPANEEPGSQLVTSQIASRARSSPCESEVEKRV